MARGWKRARPGDAIELVPMTDGGDGFGDTFAEILGAEPRIVATQDAAHRPCRSRWWFAPNNQTAIIESAKVVGLAMLPPGRFHPFELDTFGLGRVLEAAAEAGARRCVVGLGGSATNDGGFGLARALGWEFLDRAGRPIESWISLAALRCLCRPRRRLAFCELLVAVDVANPLLGGRGATRVYGPQKGLRHVDFKPADRALRRLAEVVRQELGGRYPALPGAGAAGGLGFGLAAFLGGRLVPGYELFARQTALERRLRAVDLVITGEGALDDSTLMGKGVGQIARECRRLRIPCVAIAGSVVPSRRLSNAFTYVRALTGSTDANDAKARAAFWLEQLANATARGWRVTREH